MNAQIFLNIALVYTVVMFVGAVVIFFVLMQSEDKIFTNFVNNVKKARADWKVLDKTTKIKLRLVMLAFFAVATVVSFFIYQYKKPIIVDEAFHTYNLKAVNGEELLSIESLTCQVAVDLELKREWSGDYEAYGTITIGDDTYTKSSGSVYPYFWEEDGYSVYFMLYSSNGRWAHLDMQIEKTQNGYEIVSASVEPGDKLKSEYIGPAESLEEAKTIYNAN